MSNSEKNNFGAEHIRDPEALEKAGIEQRERLRENLERAGEDSPEDLENARHEVEQINAEREKKVTEHEQRAASPAERRNNGPTARERDASFNATMDEIQTHMSPASRAFSKVIHNKAVEKVSEVGASTIARPNAILSGAIFAFTLTLGVYLVAKNLGYPLSGFETIGAFALGWALGIVYDFLKVMITGRK